MLSASMSNAQAAAITGVELTHFAQFASVDSDSANESTKKVMTPSQTIKLASIRSQIKKLERQLNVQPDDLVKQQQLTLLKSELKRGMEEQ